MSSPRVARTAALTTAALFAFAGNSILCRSALSAQAIDPVSFTALRLLSGAAILAPFLLRGERRWSLRSAAALFAYALAFSLAFVRLDAGTGALLLFGAVQVAMIGVGMRQGERSTPLRLVGIVLAATGVVLLVLPGVSAPDGPGVLLMGTAGVAWAIYSLLGRGTSAAPTVATASNFALASVAGLAVLAVRASAVEITLPGALTAIASGAITSGLGYVLWYAALTGLTATSAAVVQLAVPVIAALGGAALLGERPTPRLIGAGALTLGGVALAVLARGRRPTGPQNPETDPAPEESS